MCICSERENENEKKAVLSPLFPGRTCCNVTCAQRLVDRLGCLLKPTRFSFFSPPPPSSDCGCSSTKGCCRRQEEGARRSRRGPKRERCDRVRQRQVNQRRRNVKHLANRARESANQPERAKLASKLPAGQTRTGPAIISPTHFFSSPPDREWLRLRATAQPPI